MAGAVDVREKAFLTSREVRELNFIRDTGKFFFRRHNHQGLRSHIFEILDAASVQREHNGIEIDGYRRYPRALPKYVLRIFRSKFNSPEEAFAEISRYSIVLRFLGPELIAQSSEFIVDYIHAEKKEITLCGIQEFVDGSVLNPWQLPVSTSLDLLYQGSIAAKGKTHPAMLARYSIQEFIRRTLVMIIEAGYIPDLAGHGNLLFCRNGTLKLVDINNIIKVALHDRITLDDKGYPSCDKSIEALSLLIKRFLPEKQFPGQDILDHFLSESRMAKVQQLEKDFYHSFH